jgi:hypothetical protein
MRVFHFVNRCFGLENLRRRRLKIAEIQDLNDPFELRSLTSGDRVVRRAFDETRDALARKSGLLCFSSAWRNPVLWSHYADRHRGIALGFDVADECLTQVRYRRDRPPFDPAMLAGAQEAAEALMLELLTTKFSHWRYETEWRAFVSLNERDPDNGLYFMEYSEQIRLREVIVGAHSTISRDELAQSLGSLAPEIRTTKARLAFRTFDVVSQRKGVLWT